MRQTSRFAALLLFLLPAFTFASGGEEQDFTVYYTSSLNGNLDGCSCISNPKAGLVKRAAYLRARPRGDSILVDAGDILDVSPDPDLGGQVVDVYRELGYDAVGMGDQELANGLDALLEYASRLPILSNNLSVTTTSSPRPLSPVPVSILKGSLRVNIVSLIDPDVFVLYPARIKSRLTLTRPADALRSFLQRPQHSNERETARLTVLLYHGPVEAAAELVRETAGIDVLVVGHEQRLVHPEKVGSTILVSPGEEGNRLGMLKLRFRKGRIVGYSHEFRLFDYGRDIDDSAVRKRVDQYLEALRSRAKGS